MISRTCGTCCHDAVIGPRDMPEPSIIARIWSSILIKSLFRSLLQHNSRIKRPDDRARCRATSGSTFARCFREVQRHGRHSGRAKVSAVEAPVTEEAEDWLLSIMERSRRSNRVPGCRGPWLEGAPRGRVREKVPAKSVPTLVHKTGPFPSRFLRSH